MTDNPFRPQQRVQFRNILVRRDHPELRTGTVTEVRHHVVTVEWDSARSGAASTVGSYHHSTLIEIN